MDSPTQDPAYGSGIQAKVREILAAQAGWADPGQVLPTHRLDELGLDSLDIADVTMKLEERFNIRLDGDTLASLGIELRTVDDLINACDRAPTAH